MCIFSKCGWIINVAALVYMDAVFFIIMTKHKLCRLQKRFARVLFKQTLLFILYSNWIGYRPPAKFKFLKINYIIKQKLYLGNPLGKLTVGPSPKKNSWSAHCMVPSVRALHIIFMFTLNSVGCGNIFPRRIIRIANAQWKSSLISPLIGA